MTDVAFRISGAVSPELTPEDINETGIQVIHHGIGYDRIPVSNTPTEYSDGALSSENVAAGIFMAYMPQGHEAGKYYPKGSVVSDGTWHMISKVLTLEYPFPTLAGDINWGIAAFAPITQSNVSSVFSGHTYTFNEAVYATAIRIWVTQLTVDTVYRAVVVETGPNGGVKTTVTELPTLTAGAWKTVALLNRIILAGTSILVYIDALNSGANNIVAGGWTYDGQSNNGAPPAQAWNHNNAQELLRIDKTDLDSTDRTSELLGIITNSTIRFADTANVNAFNLYRVTGAPTDSGSDVTFPVVLSEQGEGGVSQGTTTMTATVPIAQATEYAEQAAVVPSYLQDIDVLGYLAYDRVKQAGDANTYGVDIEIEAIDTSPDWDVFSYLAP